jgi:hypothetical protein
MTHNEERNSRIGLDKDGSKAIAQTFQYMVDPDHITVELNHIFVWWTITAE